MSSVVKNPTLFLLLLVLACVQAAQEPVTPTELEGTWIGRELEGRSGEWTLMIAGHEFYLNGPGGYWLKGTLELNTAIRPKHLDLRILECECSFAGATALAVYKLEENTLTLAGVEPGRKDRPTSLTTGGGARVLSFRRYS